MSEIESTAAAVDVADGHARPMFDEHRPASPIRAARGTARSCSTWDAAAALRMLSNNLDPEVAVDWENLVVYGGSGRAARNWKAYRQIVAALQGLREDETLCVQSGKPVYVARTWPEAPRRAHRQLQLGSALGNRTAFRGSRSTRPDDVRADDGRIVDLHRHAGNLARHLRDVRRAGETRVRCRQPRRQVCSHSRSRGHERSPTPLRQR